MAISAPPRRRSQAVPRRHRTLAGALVLALIAVLVLATALVVLLVRGGSRSSGVQGSGVAATQSRVLPGFSRLDLAGSASVTVVTGGRQSVAVRADNNLIRYVTTRVAAGTLFIGTTGSYTTRTPMSVEVSAPSLAAVTLSGSGEISVSGIKAPRLTVTLPGSGALYASGTADRLDVTLGGSGLAQLSNLIARDARAVVAGSGLIRMNATASLNATVSGTGAIIYDGNPPHVTTNVTGTGAVMRAAS